MGLCTFVMTFGILFFYLNKVEKELNTLDDLGNPLLWSRFAIIGFFVLAFILALMFFNWVCIDNRPKKSEKTKEQTKE